MEKPLFYSARLKIEWANHHIKELVRVLKTFPQAGFHYMGVKEDAKTAGAVLEIEVKDELLDKITLIIGDAIHNLRVALDHVAYELVTLSHGTPTTSTRFPFGKTRQETIAAMNGAIQGICLDIITCIVECVQPYKGGNGDALYVLHTLDITDKHRLIVPVFSTVGMKVLAKDDDGGVRYLAFALAPSEETRMVHLPSSAKIEGYSNLMLRILFDDVKGFERHPVVETLRKLRKIVLATVEEVERAYLGSRKLFSS